MLRYASLKSVRLLWTAVACAGVLVTACSGPSSTPKPTPSRSAPVADGQLSGVLVISAIREYPTRGTVQISGTPLVPEPWIRKCRFRACRSGPTLRTVKPQDSRTHGHRCPSCEAELHLMGERQGHLLLRCTSGHEFEWSSAAGYVEQAHPSRSERVATADYRAKGLTTKLRGSQERLYASLRAGLTRIGLPVGTTHLAELFPDGPAEHWGALVTEERQVLTFTLRDDGEFMHQDRTESWRQVPHNAGVEAILLRLGEG
jgi:hypothetical protein